MLVCLALLLGFAGTMRGQTAEDPVKDRPSALRIGVQGGLAYRLGAITPLAQGDAAKYVAPLKKGLTFGADVTWFFIKPLGAGIKFHDMHAFTGVGDVQDNVDIWYLGPILSYRLLHGRHQNAFCVSVGTGYMGYHDKAVWGTPVVLDGGALGYMGEVGYDIHCSNTILDGQLLFGVSLSFYGGVMREAVQRNNNGTRETIGLNEKTGYESLHQIDVSIGLRWVF